MDHFSATQLNMFLRCPAQYEFRYLEKRILPPTSSLTKGRCVHKGAEYNYRQKLTTAADVSLEEVADIVAGVFDSEAVATAWEPDENKGAVKDQTLALTSLYHQAVAPTIQPLFVEHEFCLPLPGGVPLRGFIDVIDDTFVIRDIKTSARSPGDDEAKKSPQLAAYAWAYRELTGQLETAVALDYLVQTKTPKTVTIQTSLTADDLGRLFAIIGQVLDAIQAGVFYPNPSNFLCTPKACGYWNLCHARHKR